MITLCWSNTEEPVKARVGIGITREDIENGKKIDNGHLEIDTSETPHAAQLLETINALAPEAIEEFEKLLTNIYNLGIAHGTEGVIQNLADAALKIPHE